MTKVLFFEGDYDAVLADKVKVKDGMVEFEGRTMIIDKAVPISLKTGSGKLGRLFGEKDAEPLYILKWNSVEPSSNIHKPVMGYHRDTVSSSFSRAKGVNPLFNENGVISPEMLRKLVGLKILGNMIKVKKDGFSLGESKKLIVLLIAGVVAVVVFAYMNGYITF
jgi:hypothetical protein